MDKSAIICLFYHNTLVSGSLVGSGVTASELVSVTEEGSGELASSDTGLTAGSSGISASPVGSGQVSICGIQNSTR